jgi:sec-independent protein translocase protein TatA
MGSFSIWHWLVVLLVILLLFGSGKISGLMGDLAKGIKSFKQNMKEDDPKDASMAADATPPAQPRAASPARPLAPRRPARRVPPTRSVRPPDPTRRLMPGGGPFSVRPGEGSDR